MVDLLAAHQHINNNRAEVEASKVCGCFHCVRIFPPSDIVAWTGLDLNNFEDPEAANAETALCPRCGSESVIGDKSGYEINAQFLSRMQEAWYQRTVVRKI
ncbi:MAG: cytoplasmic protein [Burkholderiales bacterium]|nr:cytoplasmic protein [Burkholderiales bacterium]